jgi:predicted RND superfamily exporter protein
MIRRLLLLTIFTLLFAISAAAQTNAQFPKSDDSMSRSRERSPKDRSSNDSDQNASLPEEMRIRLAIERADIEYRKTLADAEKLNDLSTEVAKVYRERGSLSPEEVKKVGTIEKLAKRILSQAGGDEVDDKTRKTEQMSLADACEQLSSTAAKIKDSMKTQTRFVVSAAVIASSNEVINLAQFIRHSQK